MESNLARPRVFPVRHSFWMLSVVLILGSAAVAAAQNAPQAVPPDFGKLAAKLIADRADGIDESEAVEEQALKILDAAALEQLNGSAPDLDAVNQLLAGLVTHQPAEGEGYRAVRLGTEPPAYVLVANFGLGGPSAARVYSGAAGHVALTGRVDPFVQKEFFDDYLDLALLPGPGGVFVIVSGRTDDLQTGIFTAWRLDGQRLVPLWTSDILEQSSYEVGADGLRLTYCAETDSNDFRVCKLMQRDRYAWQGGSWKRAESAAVPVPSAASKP